MENLCFGIKQGLGNFQGGGIADIGLELFDHTRAILENTFLTIED
jgi:hypothetical protein